MARKTKEEAERTYHALLDAAALLFTQKGVSNTTLNDIAKYAGMTRGAVYWHFDNKDSVIMALWERNASETHREFLEKLQHLTAQRAALELRELIKLMVQKVSNEPQLAQVMRIVMNNVELTDEATDLQRFMQNRKEMLQNALIHAMETLNSQQGLRLISPELAAQGLLAYLHGLIHAYLEPGRESLDLKRDGNTLLDLYLDAILL